LLLLPAMPNIFYINPPLLTALIRKLFLPKIVIVLQ